jgi:hypothetical protein
MILPMLLATAGIVLQQIGMGTVGAARAQSGPEPAAGPQPDSAEVAKDLRSHQRRFEHLRRDHLPWIWPSSGPCDERIGRFCFTFDDDENEQDWSRFEEPPEVHAARDELIAALWRGTREYPNHWWIVGQLVRYLIEADRPAEAIGAASRCRVSAPDDWWCDALSGMAHHAAAGYVHAERAFDAALETMPFEDRCDWTDLSDLLRGDVHGHYDDVPCAERDSVQRRIWWLSDPFLSQPGNELRTEHFSRWVMIRLQDDAESVEPTSWGNDMRRITVRYGWPDGWEQIRRGPSNIGPPDVTSHYGRGAKTFVAHSDVLEQPYAVQPDDWDIDPDRPRSEHAVAFAIDGIKPVRLQTSFFRVGDSIALLANYEVTDDRLTDSTQTDAYLVASRNAQVPPLLAHSSIRGRRGTLALVMPAELHVVGVEVLARGERRAGWSRFGFDPLRNEEPMIASDLLIVFATDSLPSTLDAAIAMARPDVPFRPGERVGLYWEVYGAPPEASIRIGADLAVGREGKSIFRRIAELTPFASDDPPVHMRWTDIKPAGDDVLQRAIAVDLPSDLSNGDYRVRVVLDIDGTALATLERTIRIEDGE